ncbi:MAG: extracellular solute-binding protein, partial [Chloroflexi bacterium]|nr:extracellular solute-binding protein [Chloroflexota bacterium]
MNDRRVTRRNLLRTAAVFVAGASLAACAPKVIKETVVVEKEVEKVVKETVQVEKVVEKQVTTVVEKEVTRVVEKAAPKQKIMLRLGKFAGNAWDFDVKWSKIFMEENPHITVQIEDVPYNEMFPKCLALGATGLMWDVFTGHNIWSPYLAWKGITMQLDEFIETHDIDFEDFFPSVIADSRLWTNNRLCWLPTVVHPGGNAVVGFNMDMLREAGVELPPKAVEGDWTIMDWEEIVRKVAKPREQWGIQLDGMKHPLYIQQFVRTWGLPTGGPGAAGSSEDSWLLSYDGRKHQLGDEFPRVKAGLEWYAKWGVEGYRPTDADAQQLAGVDLFTAGKMVSRAGTVGQPENWRARIGDKFEPLYVPWPKGPDGNRGSCLSYNTMAVYTRTQYPEDSFNLAARLTSKEPALYAGTEG